MTQTKLHTVALFFAFGVAALGVAVPGSVEAESGDDILVVANKKVEVKSISMAEARAFFLKERTSWKSGGKVVPVNAPAGTALRKKFRRKVLGMDAAHEQSYWQDEGIRRGLVQPPEFGNTLKAVFKLKGAVSYVYRKDFNADVAKVLLVIE